MQGLQCRPHNHRYPRPGDESGTDNPLLSDEITGVSDTRVCRYSADHCQSDVLTPSHTYQNNEVQRQELSF